MVMRLGQINGSHGRLLGPPPDAAHCRLLQRTTRLCMKSCSLTIRLEDDLEQELQLMRFERLRRQALPFGEAAGWLTDDDVFTAIS